MTALTVLGFGLAALAGVVAALWWRRRHRSWITDDDVFDLAESLDNPRARMPVEPTAQARADGARVRIPTYREEV